MSIVDERKNDSIKLNGLNLGLIRMRYTPYGGAEVFLSRFIDELIRIGHTCHVLASKWDDVRVAKAVGAEDFLPLLIFHRVRTFGPSFLRILLFAFNSFIVVRKKNLDVVISFERTLLQDIYRAGDGCHKEWLIQREKARGEGQGAVGREIIKKIITYLNPLHVTLLFLENRLFKSNKLKFVVANSNRGKDEIIRHYKLPKEKICVIYNGIDVNDYDLSLRDKIRTDYRKKLNLKDEITLLFVGSGFERKGLGFLLEALSICKKNTCNSLKLIVAGKGNIRKYMNVAFRLNIGNDVIFTGPIKDVKGYYYASDIFVLPSIYEPFSNACLEAMASGIPVVTSSINGVSEILTDGQNGMIVNNPANPEELFLKIKPLLDEQIRQEAGRKARITVEGYTIEKNVEQFLSLIHLVRGGAVL